MSVLPSRLVARLRMTNPHALDAILAAMVLTAVSLQYLLPEEGGDPVTWAGFLLGAGTAVPLVARRRAPYVCGLVVVAFTVAMALYHRPPPDVAYGGLVVLYTVAALSRPWQRWSMLAAAFTSATLTMEFTEHAEPIEYAFHLLSFASAYGLGVLSRVQQAYAQRLEREREIEAARAAAQERARITRDMHDILAHAVSLMVVQAEAGPVVVRSDPARAEAAFDAIAGAGRDAMAQLRRILGVLNQAGTGAGTGPLAPQPTVAALPDLARQVTATGLCVDLRTTGRARPLPPDTEIAAYHVVQEALTNTLKHGDATTAVVHLDWQGDTLAITVTDDGRGAPRPLPGTGSGHGLVGIRERAAACGGTATAGNVPGGTGFEVVAHLPAPAPAAAR
jgi:signal transduction histidine kinase